MRNQTHARQRPSATLERSPTGISRWHTVQTNVGSGTGAGTASAGLDAARRDRHQRAIDRPLVDRMTTIYSSRDPWVWHGIRQTSVGAGGSC